MENGGQEMLDEIYKGQVLTGGDALPDSNVTLAIDCSNIPKTQKVKKTMSEEEATQVRAKNEEIRKERETTAEKVAQKYSSFKRDFMSAPIWKAFKMVQAKKGHELKPCQIDYRKDERFWVCPSEKDVSVTFEINFESETD
mmetsp:Transcript_18517/g.28436  ORF Transcript_18517/g.28436 Transcript_18517/m.28436 type:complete len:141 (-) Transcript_18517:460-882(-)